MFNHEELLKFIQDLIEKHRVEIGERPKVTSVVWKGVGMSFAEAKMIIKELEKRKLVLQQNMNDLQTGGEITNLATSGAGMAAMITGAALMLFPPTAIAGVITLASGAGTAGIGKMIGDGVSNIGTNSNTQAIQQIDNYISSLKTTMIDSYHD